MQFNSLVFALFMAVVLPLYLALRRPHRLRQQNLLLLVASYVFYAAWDWRFLGLLALSTVVDYTVGLALARHRARSGPQRGARLWLLLSVSVNLTILGFFKYWNFFVASAAAALGGLGLHPNLPLLELTLPVGISFYTFQTIAYTYSVYKGEVPPTRDVVAFAVYVAYFPQLVAGPIERASHLLPQIQRPRAVDWHKASSGARLVLLGLFKKIAIADAAAVYVDAVFGTGTSGAGASGDLAGASSATLWLGVYMFALQIYGDFSGYTDIARGVSRVLGIDLMLNFRQPYLAADITDFWRRWHISLSTWLREHIYIPLGGNRHGAFNTYRNLMLTMLLGGLWHGAGWTFVIWGGLHGAYLAVHKVWLAGRPAGAVEAGGALRRVAGVLLTFHLVCFAWIFFRARDLDAAWQVIRGIGALDFTLSEAVPVSCLGLLGLSFVLDCVCARTDQRVPLGGDALLFARSLVYGTAVTMMILANTGGDVPFIYFQF